MTLIKICGITNIDDALACAELGANMLGFVFAESPRRVDAETAREIVSGVRERALQHPSPNTQHPITTVGVFLDDSLEILDIVNRCEIDFAQLHGGQSEKLARTIGADKVIRVTRVKNEFSIDALADHESAAYYLLDTYKKGQPGGTGETFDWSLAVLARGLLRKPIILSGGLNPDNVFNAVRAVRPYAVDVSSGVESSPGRKDIAKVKEFIEHVREADNAS